MIQENTISYILESTEEQLKHLRMKQLERLASRRRMIRDTMEEAIKAEALVMLINAIEEYRDRIIASSAMGKAS